jgi:SAM-dependent methyltransferase
VIQADATALPFLGEVFDAAVAVNVLDHLPEPTVAISEVHRVLSCSLPWTPTGTTAPGEPNGPAAVGGRGAAGRSQSAGKDDPTGSRTAGSQPTDPPEHADTGRQGLAVPDLPPHPSLEYLRKQVKQATVPPYGSSPSCRARVTAWVRLAASSLSNRWLRCFSPSRG